MYIAIIVINSVIIINSASVSTSGWQRRFSRHVTLSSVSLFREMVESSNRYMSFDTNAVKISLFSNTRETGRLVASSLTAQAFTSNVYIKKEFMRLEEVKITLMILDIMYSISDIPRF